MEILMGNQQEKIIVTPQMEEVIDTIGKEISQRFFLKDVTEVSVTFVDDRIMQDLNKIYRGIDRTTDVLSFAFDEEADGVGGVPVNEAVIHLLGEIIISLERTIVQAAEYGHSVERELAFLFVHGMLHLLGYDHQEELETEEMRKKEEEILDAVNYRREGS